MEGTISNKHKCKECIWFDGCKCLEPNRNRINEEKGWNYYRNFRKMPSEPACIRFEEKENDILNEESLKDFQAVLDSTYKTLDAMEGMLDRELEIRGEVKDVDDPKAHKNRYGIGETLYLPVKITGIRESMNGSTVLYEIRTIDSKRIGFKVFECVSDFWRDKDHMATVPEHFLVENFEEA